MVDWLWTYTSPTGETLSWGAGTIYRPQKLTGLDGFEEVRSSTTDIPRGHGAVPGQHFLPPRMPVFDLKVVANDMTAAREAALKALVPSVSEDGILSWQRPGETARMLYCRPIAAPWPTERHQHVATPKFAFEAADPRMYSSAGKSATLDPYTTSGGVNDPVNDPKDATVSGSDVAVTNAGNVGAPVVLRFYGPTSGTCTGVQLTNRTTGVAIDVQTNIEAGQILTVDMRAFIAATGARVIDLSGSGRYGDWQQTRQAVLIEPGSNLLRFTADGTTTGMSCRVDFADAWIS